MNQITLRNGDGDCIDNHDLAVLADWAEQQRKIVPNNEWKRPFALIRDGADLLQRRRARATENLEKETICKSKVPAL